MARPRSFDTGAVVAQITNLFWAKGFEAVSIQEIAEVTGLRPGSIHAAFGNKDDLFEVAFAHYGARFQTHMDVAASGIDGAAEYLDRLVASAAGDPERKGCLIVNTASEMAMHRAATQTAAEDRLKTMRAFFEARLAEDGVRSSAASNALFGAAVAVLTLARAHQPEDVLRDIAASAISMARREKGSSHSVGGKVPRGRGKRT